MYQSVIDIIVTLHEYIWLVNLYHVNLFLRILLYVHLPYLRLTGILSGEVIQRFSFLPPFAAGRTPFGRVKHKGVTNVVPLRKNGAKK